MAGITPVGEEKSMLVQNFASSAGESDNMSYNYHSTDGEGAWGRPGWKEEEDKDLDDDEDEIDLYHDDQDEKTSTVAAAMLFMKSYLGSGMMAMAVC